MFQESLKLSEPLSLELGLINSNYLNFHGKFLRVENKSHLHLTQDQSSLKCGMLELLTEMQEEILDMLFVKIHAMTQVRPNFTFSSGFKRS